MSYRLTTKISWAQTQSELSDSFDRWGVKEWETNYPRGARLSGFNQSLADRTVRVSYMKNGKLVNLEMGKQARAVDNLRVLYISIESMRMNEKRGISEVLQSAYAQIEGPRLSRAPHEVLQIMQDAPIEVAEAAYRARATVLHPDKGGDIHKFKELNEAIAAFRKGNHAQG